MTESMRFAIFVKMKHLIGPVNIISGNKYRPIHTENIDGAIRAIHILTPHIVVANAVIENGHPGSFVNAIRSRFPDFRFPVIICNVEQAPQTLIVNEWIAAQGQFRERSALPENLKEEIERLDRPQLDVRENLDELRCIGFADTICSGERSIHIQTEIITFEGIKIKTTTLDRGAVIDVICQTVDRAEGDIIDWARKTARQQHDKAVEGVHRGNDDRAPAQ